jgi:hypothetical protein
MRYVRIIKYWFKLTKTDNIILEHAYRIAYDDCLLGKKNWLSNVKKILYDYGFAHVWDSSETVCEKSLYCVLNNGLSIVLFKGGIEVYNHVKSNFEYENTWIFCLAI